MPNKLINETSPYLLQHANNPVDWHAWDDEAFAKAKQENKLILISIGYSSCHWCHVMEHESFEDIGTAEIMNEYFVCIKVDREERPDVDNVYMHAVQLITGRGGWPLNCFALPDGRPIYGGTYFPKTQWQYLLKQLAKMYAEEKNKCEQYAHELTEGINRSELMQFENESTSAFNKNVLEQCVMNWMQRFDYIEGGPQKAPKFALPNNYLFLLRYGFLSGNKDLLKHVELTLDKMAMGGIYDHVGGGFARYSTDAEWKVPHFEKMLYDNAQLISLYSEAYSLFKKNLYKKTAIETISFLNREMKNNEGLYYSALDADSEGIEGKYYIWSKPELQEAAKEISSENTGKTFDIISEYFSINKYGLWEHGNYILLRKTDEKVFCNKFEITETELERLIKDFKKILLEKRNKRIRPGLDDKSLTSWNGLMITALCDAFFHLKEEQYLNDACNLADILLSKQKQGSGRLFHCYKNNSSTITGFLEDYCFTVEALIKLYECSTNERYINEANEMMDYVFANFLNNETGIFYFSDNNADKLIVRKTETQDNVIPASNSSIAKCLFYLGKHFGNENYIQHANRMLNYFSDNLVNYGSAYSNWALLGLHFAYPFKEIVITGANSGKLIREFADKYRTNYLLASCEKDSLLPLLANRIIKNKTLIYVCENNTCKLPVESIDAIEE